MTNYKQLSKEDRNTIENLINKGLNFLLSLILLNTTGPLYLKK